MSQQSNELISCGLLVSVLEHLELPVHSELLPHKASNKIPNLNSYHGEKVEGRRWGRRESLVSVLVEREINTVSS